MTSTLIITLNLVLDVAILGLSAFVMSHPRKLTPHGEAAATERAPVALPARERDRGRRSAAALLAQLD